MPSEKLFAKTFRDITLNRNIRSKIRCTEIHLASDYIISCSPTEIIVDLYNKLYGKLGAKLIQSNIDEYSLYLEPPRELDSEQGSKILIKFYDKGNEYYRRNKTYICQLNEPLSPKDIKQVGSAYNPEKKELDLSNVNWLRIEIELHEKPQVRKLTNLLKDNENDLTANILLEVLESNALYGTIDDLFETLLKRHVFFENTTVEKATNKKDVVNKVARKLLLDNQSSIKEFQASFEELGYGTQFKSLTDNLKKIQSYSESTEELYNKIFFTVKKQKPNSNGYFQRSCNSYNSLQVVVYILVLDIYIWDDS